MTLTSERAVRRDVVVRDPSRFNASMATGSASAQYLLFRVAHECSLHFNFKEATADSTGIKCPQSFLIKPPLTPSSPPRSRQNRTKQTDAWPWSRGYPTVLTLRLSARCWLDWRVRTGDARVDACFFLPGLLPLRVAETDAVTVGEAGGGAASGTLPVGN